MILLQIILFSLTRRALNADQLLKSNVSRNYVFFLFLIVVDSGIRKPRIRAEINRLVRINQFRLPHIDLLRRYADIWKITYLDFKTSLPSICDRR